MATSAYRQVLGDKEHSSNDNLLPKSEVTDVVVDAETQIKSRSQTEHFVSNVSMEPCKGSEFRRRQIFKDGNSKKKQTDFLRKLSISDSEACSSQHEAIIYDKSESSVMVDKMDDSEILLEDEDEKTKELLEEGKGSEEESFDEEKYGGETDTDAGDDDAEQDTAEKRNKLEKNKIDSKFVRMSATNDTLDQNIVTKEEDTGNDGNAATYRDKNRDKVCKSYVVGQMNSNDALTDEELEEMVNSKNLSVRSSRQSKVESLNRRTKVKSKIKSNCTEEVAVLATSSQRMKTRQNTVLTRKFKDKRKSSKHKLNMETSFADNKEESYVKNFEKILPCGKGKISMTCNYCKNVFLSIDEFQSHLGGQSSRLIGDARKGETTGVLSSDKEKHEISEISAKDKMSLVCKCGRQFRYSKSFEKHLLSCLWQVSSLAPSADTSNVLQPHIEADSISEVSPYVSMDIQSDNHDDTLDSAVISETEKTVHVKKKMRGLNMKAGRINKKKCLTLSRLRLKRKVGNSVGISHEEGRAFNCSICKEIFTDKNEFLDHKKMHDFCCMECGEAFSSRRDFLVHKKSHKVIKQFVCKYCDDIFIHKADYISHVSTHKGEKLSCEHCGEQFTCKATLRVHKKTHSSVVKVLSCNTCGKVSKNRKAWRNHAKCHLKRYKCQDCGALFSRNAHLVRHINGHKNIRSFVCEFCGKGFKWKYDLARHIRIHSGVKPFVCTVCNKGFNQGSNLTIHMRTHTGQKSYMCDLCGTAYGHQCSLKDHVKKHHPERAVEFDVTSKHAVAHVDQYPQDYTALERLFICEYCDKAFKTVSQMKKHKGDVHVDDIQRLSQVQHISQKQENIVSDCPQDKSDMSHNPQGESNDNSKEYDGKTDMSKTIQVSSNLLVASSVSNSLSVENNVLNNPHVESEISTKSCSKDYYSSISGAELERNNPSASREGQPYNFINSQVQGASASHFHQGRYSTSVPEQGPASRVDLGFQLGDYPAVIHGQEGQHYLGMENFTQDRFTHRGEQQYVESSANVTRDYQTFKYI